MARKSNTKLTTAHRTLAIGALTIHACASRSYELFQAARMLGDRVYQEIYDPSQRALMASLPKGWLVDACEIEVSAAGWRGRLLHTNPAQSFETFCADAKHRMPYIANYGPGQLSVVADHSLGWRMPASDLVHGRTRKAHVVEESALAQEIQVHMQACRGWEEQGSEVFHQIKSAVIGFKTVEALLKAVPELEELAPDLLQQDAPRNALVPDMSGVMCTIAKLRGEEREGCCAEEAPLAA
jgi:hypothetical protein